MLEFTIFTCTFQNAQFIYTCYHSILAQNQKNWEWLIIDDGSTDDTEVIIKNISDSRIVYYRLDKNVGRGEARNYGMKFIKGKWVVILDMDDLMLPERLDRVRAAIDGKYEFMISQAGLIKNNLICTGIRPAFHKRGIKIFTHATLCCNSDLYKEIGYFDSRYSEDQKIIVLLANKSNFLIVNEPLYLYRENANQNIKGAKIANITAFRLLIRFICSKKDFVNMKMLYYIFGFFVRYIVLAISQRLFFGYDLFVKNRIGTDEDLKQIERVNKFTNNLVQNLKIIN